MCIVKARGGFGSAESGARVETGDQGPARYGRLAELAWRGAIGLGQRAGDF